MQIAPIPVNEEERLAKLRDYDILDTQTEQDYDDIARLAAQICGTELSTISFVDRDRQWYKASVGMSARETSRDVAFCAHTILGEELFVVEDASSDPRFDDNPLVTIDPKLRFYAGMPLQTPDGFRLGALCAIDKQPRTLTEAQKSGLQILARHVVDLLELRRTTRLLANQNRELLELSDLKSRLMSIIAHDLRSPMASISSIMSLFQEHDLEADEKKDLLKELGQVLDSTRYLLDNVIGWAARQLETSHFVITETELSQLVHELADSIHHDVERKGNSLLVEVASSASIWADRNILVFVIRNLLMNANKFTSNGTITLRCDVIADTAVFEVVDSGVGMDPERAASLFDWARRTRTVGTSGEKGAGLALLFCHDFIGRIGGSLTVDSEPGSGTTMTISVPVDCRSLEPDAG